MTNQVDYSRENRIKYLINYESRNVIFKLTINLFIHI